MEEGIDDIDLMNDEYGLNEENNTQTQDNSGNVENVVQVEDTNIDNGSSEATSSTESAEDPFISLLLKSRGIEDPTKIKFENENGEIEEVDWNTLDNNDKLNILNLSFKDTGEDLDASEIELLNAIRESQLTPAEYIQYIQRNSVENYIQNSQSNYSVDQYDDDELFIMDLMSRSNEITEEEALEALERAKANEALFKKLIGATRMAYQQAEEESLKYSELKQKLEAQEQFDRFAENIENSIINFKTFSGGQIDMSDDEMQDVYNFITGEDSAGNSWFGKALRDPDTVVRMAWFELFGEKMIQDITDYYEKEITNVRKESYKKGLAEKKDKPIVTYKPKNKNSKVVDDDLDDF